MAENSIQPRTDIEKRLWEWVEYLDEAARKSALYSQRHFRFLGIVSIAIPLAYVADYVVGKPSFDTLAVRCSAFLLATPLIFYNSRPIRSFTHFHIYFVSLVAFVLPFSFGLMLIMNAATTPSSSQIEVFWILQYFISLFLFIQLINNGPLATLLWAGSTVLAISPIAFLDEVNWSELESVMIYPVTVYMTALFFGIITNRNIDYINAEKLRAASAIGGNIAHELRTPLASIRSLARSVRRHSEALAKGYEMAKEAGMNVDHLTARQVDGLKTALELVEREVQYSNTVIDMLLINTSEHSTNGPPAERLDIVSLLNEAIDRYPFNNSRERNLICLVATRSFSVSASRVLIVHVFFNLLKNSVYYAQKRPTGTVTVRVDGDSRTIKFTDTGYGLTSISRRRVFDRFYTTAKTGQGAGIGLSFCKMVMESIGGDIECESKEGEYTTFRLTFPPVNEAETQNRSS